MHTGRNIAPQATGERNFKITSPYLVFTSRSYTKHYYAGSERVAARIGGGNLDHDTACIVADEEATERADRLFDWCLRQVKETAIAPLDLSSLDIRTIDGDRMDAPWWLDEAPTGLEAGLKLNVWKLLHAIDILSSPSTVPPDTDDEPDVYFYHSDHLGSASWITDASGNPVQHLQYLPFGEPFVNQRVSDYSERFTFTGKERDEETGYGYFGAKYMDHELMTMWLSVDPLADKYPNISPYNYCMWNPIRVVDPNGMDTIQIHLDKGRYKYTKSDGDHCIEFYRGGEKLDKETISISREDCGAITDFGPQYGVYNDEVVITQYLGFSNPASGKAVFEKIAELGASRDYDSKEWDYYNLGTSGELSSSGRNNLMGHHPERYESFTEWDHFHPNNEDQSFYPSTTDQDRARAHSDSRCVMYSQGKCMEFGSMVPSEKKRYISQSKYADTWRRFAR